MTGRLECHTEQAHLTSLKITTYLTMKMNLDLKINLSQTNTGKKDMIKKPATGTTVAISKDDLAQIHELCIRDSRTVKAVVSIALREYFEREETIYP